MDEPQFVYPFLYWGDIWRVSCFHPRSPFSCCLSCKAWLNYFLPPAFPRAFHNALFTLLCSSLYIVSMKGRKLCSLVLSVPLSFLPNICCRALHMGAQAVTVELNMPGSPFPQGTTSLGSHLWSPRDFFKNRFYGPISLGNAMYSISLFKIIPY